MTKIASTSRPLSFLGELGSAHAKIHTCHCIQEARLKSSIGMRPHGLSSTVYLQARKIYLLSQASKESSHR